MVRSTLLFYIGQYQSLNWETAIAMKLAVSSDLMEISKRTSAINRTRTGFDSAAGHIYNQSYNTGPFLTPSTT